jgi:hypothetical protein
MIPSRIMYHINGNQDMSLGHPVIKGVAEKGNFMFREQE